MSRRLAVVALAALLLPAGGWAATRVIAFGDSLVEGDRPFDELGRGGFPSRLGNMLTNAGLEDVEVLNAGVPGETTVEGLSRVGAILAGGGDIFILLEGTNDVQRILLGVLTFEDTVNNLRAMLSRAESQEMRSIVGTVPPRRPDASRDRSNVFTYELVLRIRDLAARSRRELVDFWDLLPPVPETFSELYYTGPDPVGHPNAAGFELMARASADVILPGDSQRPVEGRLLRPTEVTEIAPDETLELEIYDFGEGLDRSSVTFTVNGRPVATRVTGNSTRSVMLHENEEIEDCFARIGIQADDLAEPPNRAEFQVAEFGITGRTVIVGDLDFDCRVDGADLVAFARAFGSEFGDERYRADLDFNADGLIDGEDLARLADNFGRRAAT